MGDPVTISDEQFGKLVDSLVVKLTPLLTPKEPPPPSRMALEDPGMSLMAWEAGRITTACGRERERDIARSGRRVGFVVV